MRCGESTPSWTAEAVVAVDAWGSPRLSVLPRELAAAEFDLFRSTGAQSDVAAGETLFRRGELGRHLFVVESGAVRLEFGGEIRDKTITPREFFGELALFVGAHTRMANATHLAPTPLRVIDAEQFQNLLQAAPAGLARFMPRSLHVPG